MNRLFITGIPASGKSYLAKKLAEKTDGVAVMIDDFRESLAADERYKKWVNFFLDKNEEKYYKEISLSEQWNNIVLQSEGLWPVFLEKINSFKEEKKPMIFECVNILPHLAKKDLDFPGIVLLGKSYEDILMRNIKDPRWGKTRDLQEMEAKSFFEVERPHYKAEAEKFGYMCFDTADEAFDTAFKMLTQ